MRSFRTFVIVSSTGTCRHHLLRQLLPGQRIVLSLLSFAWITSWAFSIRSFPFLFPCVPNHLLWIFSARHRTAAADNENHSPTFSLPRTLRMTVQSRGTHWKTLPGGSDWKNDDTGKSPGKQGTSEMWSAQHVIYRSDLREEDVSSLSTGSAAPDQVAAGYAPRPARVQVSRKHTLISYPWLTQTSWKARSGLLLHILCYMLETEWIIIFKWNFSGPL